MSKEIFPKLILQFWSDIPTVYTKDDIYHLEPSSETAVFLKYLALIGKTDEDSDYNFITLDEDDFITSDDLIFITKS